MFFIVKSSSFFSASSTCFFVIFLLASSSAISADSLNKNRPDRMSFSSYALWYILFRLFSSYVSGWNAYFILSFSMSVVSYLLYSLNSISSGNSLDFIRSSKSSIHAL